MQKGITCAKTLASDLKKDWSAYLEEVNFHRPFESILYLGLSNEITNTIIAAIIFSYDNESKWIDLKHDSVTINTNIIKGLYGSLDEEIYQEFINLKNDAINEAIGSYLDLLPDWRFIDARKKIDFHSQTMRKKEPDWTKVDEKDRPKVTENMGRAMREATFQREAADKLILQIEKDYVSTNHRVSQDFNASFTQKSIEFSDAPKIDISSWRDFIRYTKPEWEAAKKTNR